MFPLYEKFCTIEMEFFLHVKVRLSNETNLKIYFYLLVKIQPCLGTILVLGSSVRTEVTREENNDLVSKNGARNRVESKSGPGFRKHGILHPRVARTSTRHAFYKRGGTFYGSSRRPPNVKVVLFYGVS